MSWKSPESWNEPSPQHWLFPNLGIDGNLNTQTSNSLPAQSWSTYLYLLPRVNMEYVLSDKIRFYSDSSDYISIVDIGILTEGGWQNVYTGGYNKGEWVEKPIPNGPVKISQIRIRFYSECEESETAYIQEFQYNHLASRSLVDGSLARRNLIAGGLIR